MELLQLYDKNKNKKAGLTEYKDLCIESVLTTGDKKLSFSYSKEAKYYDEIVEEGYIRTKTQEYVIKARDIGVDYTRFDCVLNLEELEANIFDRFESVEQTITASLNLAIVGTGWTVKANTLKKKRTVRCTNKNALEIVQEIKKTYRVDIVFNTLKREIEVYEHLGEDKGTYFIDSLNLTALQVQSDSYKFATRIIAEGKEGLTFSSINNGKNYVENYQYSNKIKTIYWKDERYTVKESLLEDAKAKLEELSKPFTSYNASILNLAELNPKYKSILDYSLGDTITLLSKSNKVKDKQRIVKTIEWPQDHTKDTVELANATLKFEDIQQENQETTDTVNNITSDNGTLDSNAIEDNSIEIKKIDNFEANVLKVTKLDVINANIENLHANKADIQDLNVVKATVGQLEATKANITQLNATNAEISKLDTLKANIVDLNSATAKIGVLEAKTTSIDNLLSQKADIKDLNALNANISNALIKKANIAELEAMEAKTNKLIANKADISDLNAANANINSIKADTADIKTLINGNLSSENIQTGGITSDKLTISDGFIKDAMIANVSASKITAGTIDAAKINVVNLNADNLTVGKINGQLLKDGSISGLAIENGAIDNNKVSPNANIEASKININSVVTAINAGSTLLTANKVSIDSEKGTLDVAFNNLNTSLEANKKVTESNSTAINVVQGKLSASIENSKILEGKQKTLEDNYNRTVVTVDSLKNTVGQQKTLIDSATGKITSVEVKANTLEKNLSGLTQTVTDTKKVIENNKTVLESKNAELKANIDSVSSSLSSVSSTVDKNNKTLVAKTNTLEQNLSGLSQTVANNKTVIDGKITSVEGETHELKAGLGGLTSKLDTLKSTTDGINKTVSNQGSVINQLKDSINLKVDSSTFTQSTQTINNNITRAKEQAIIGARSIPDTRSNNENPGWYMQHYAFQTITEFKYANVIGVPNGGSWYGTLETTVPWNNASGGYPTQVFRSNSSPVYQRHGNDLNTWSSWEQIEDTQGSQDKANNALSNAKSYSDSKKQEAIKAAENLALEKSNLAKKYADEVATAKANLAKTEAIANADGKISAEEKKRIQQAQENLNTAISKADKAKQDAINEANRVAELKKQEAINSANSHADNKANEALNNAKAFVNAEITTVNSHLNKATSEINVLKEKIESKVSQSDIDKSIQEIKIGGRNLALNSSRFELPARNTGTASDNYNYISIDANLLLNSEYTISANVEIVSGSIKEISIYDYPGGKCSRVPIINNRITYTFTKRSNTVNSVLLYAGLAGETRGNSVIFTNVMLEKGNMVSDWSPAPEDTDKLIIDNIKTVTDKITTVESKFTQENNSIKASVQDLNSTTQTITTNVSNINRDLTSKINSNLDAAKTFATDIAIAKANLAKEQAIASADGKITAEEQKRIQQAQANLNTAIAKATEAETKAKSYADVKKQEAINSANNNTTNAINNLDIGIYNLANESGNFLGNTGLFVANGGTLEIDSKNTFRGYNTIKIKGNSGACYKDYIELQGNTTYCYSCWIKSDRIIPLNVSTPLHIWIKENSDDSNCHREIILKYSKEINSNWQQVFIIFKTPSNKDKYIMKPFIYGIGEATVWLANFQVKKGSILNDWTPNPNDLKKYSEEVAKAKAELAKQQAIANADGKVTEEERKRIQQAQENLNTAIARADKAKQDAINTASTDATNKANNALNSAKAFVNAEITTVNNKVHNVESNIDILKNKIALKVEQSDIDKTKTELINKINVIDNLANNAKDLASAMSLGKMLFSDPTFKNSSNNIKTYNNNGNGTVTTSRISKINGCPTDSLYCIEVKTVGSASPNHGGFYFGNMTRANAIFVTKIIAKIPVGLRIGWYSNSTGNNGSSKWLTSVNGTGKWEEYIHLLKCGDTGSFSSTSFFAVDGGGTPSASNPIVWHLAYATVFDITENDESVNVLKTEMSTAKNKVATIETNLDNITQRVSSTESKTHSIETTLGGKASKQEVAEVNNRVTTIKASLDGITQRVSATESKTQTLETNLNGKASKQEVNNVSSKVVSLETNLNGITNRVSNTESRINTLDGKVASAVTNQQFTEFKQSNDKFKFTVEQRSSVSNILPNGSFFGGDRGWLHNGSEFWAGAYSGYGFKGRITGAIKNRAAYNNPERYLQTHKAYKVKKNTTYTINFHYICEKNVQSMDAFVVLSNTEYGDYAQPLCILTAQGGSQSNAVEEKPFTYKFNTGNHEWVWLRFDHNGMKSGVNWDEFCWIYVSEVGIYEGDVGAVKWTPKGGEVYSANYQMDGLGFKGTFEDGTYASLGKDGFEWYNAGTGHAYHALTYVTSFDIPIGNPGKAYIRLPAEFTKRRSSLKWTVALRGYYYSTDGDFFPFHIHCTGGRDYIENGLVVCEVQGYCKIQNAQNAGDVQFRPLTAMLIAIA